MIDQQVPYGFTAELGSDFPQAATRVLDALKQAQFSILSDMDLAPMISAGSTPSEYRAIIACSPGLLQQAVGFEPDVGLLFASKVIIRRDSARNVVIVSFMDPVTVLALTNNPEITSLGWKERGRLEQVRDALAGG